MDCNKIQKAYTIIDNCITGLCYIDDKLCYLLSDGGVFNVGGFIGGYVTYGEFRIDFKRYFPNSKTLAYMKGNPFKLTEFVETFNLDYKHEKQKRLFETSQFN